MPQRPPRGPADAEFQRLQALWDRKLARSGFRDVEGGADLNREGCHASSFEDEKVGPKTARVSRYVQVEDVDNAERVLTFESAQLAAETLYGSASIAATPRAQAWATFSVGAHALPDGATKNLLLDIADAGCITAEIKKRHRKSRQNIRTIVARHCRALKLLPDRLLVPGRTRKRA